MANIVYLGITSKCNFHCKHCYLTPEQKNRDMPSERVFSFLGIVCGFLAILKAGGVIYEQRKL